MTVRFKVVVEQDQDGAYCVSVPSLPGCFSDGKTMDDALRNIREAIALHLETLDEDLPEREGISIQEVSV